MAPRLLREDVERQIESGKVFTVVEDGECVIDVQRLTDHVWGNLSQIEIAKFFQASQQGEIEVPEILRELVADDRDSRRSLNEMVQHLNAGVVRARNCELGSALEDVIDAANAGAQLRQVAAFADRSAEGGVPREELSSGPIQGSGAHTQAISEVEDLALTMIAAALSDECNCRVEAG